ncbi:hypothetical protein HDU86_005444 [Geranomyces michiganensis]|nr:hypothetical protein HDU86_005444 [Geranomyces michiganensis]
MAADAQAKPVSSAPQLDVTEPATTKTPSRSARKRSAGSERRKPQAKTKIVVRRLPPNLPEDIFKSSISKWLDDADWWTFVAGKVAKR